MSVVRPFALRNERLWPYDGGAAVNPPQPDTGGGTGGGGGPAGSGTGMLVGITAEPASLEAFETANSAMGPWTVHRAFNSGGFPATWAASSAGWDVGRWASVWSGKPDCVQMASGALDTAARNFLLSIPDTHTAFVTIWHESDVKIKQSTAPWTAAQYKAAWQRFFSIARELNKPHLYTTLIWGNYIYISPRSGVTMSDLWPGNDSSGRPYVDVIGFDGYSYGANETGAYMWGPGREFAHSKGVGWGIAEIGFSSQISSGANAATWMQAQADYAAANGAGPHSSAAYLCWFNSTVGGTLKCPEHFSQTRAQSALISQQYFSPYTTFVL